MAPWKITVSDYKIRDSLKYYKKLVLANLSNIVSATNLEEHLYY